MIISEQVAPNSVFSLPVEQKDIHTRIDKFISSKFPLYSRSFFQQILEEKRVTINGTTVEKQSFRVREKDVITIQFPPERATAMQAIDTSQLGIEVLAEHKHFLIVYKPAGIIVHPPSLRSTAITLVDWLIQQFQEIYNVGFVDRPGIVHRLDKDTSGILIIPRTNHAHRIFGDMFRNRTIQKTYYALVHGHPEREGSIDLPIARDPITKTRMSAPEHRFAHLNVKIRESLTHYKVVEYFDEHSLVEVKPVTGRTHQIRVHFTALGHPLVGDILYGIPSKAIKRQALHAHGLSFEFEGKQFNFQKNIPEDFQACIQKLRSQAKK